MELSACGLTSPPPGNGAKVAVCNRPHGHADHHAAYDARTFACLAKWDHTGWLRRPNPPEPLKKKR